MADSINKVILKGKVMKTTKYGLILEVGYDSYIYLTLRNANLENILDKLVQVEGHLTCTKVLSPGRATQIHIDKLNIIS